eukprot:CAMPEP_0201518198 /NCGR_PEP_ID=MMETSP0161_2-20130828/9106_1 /ASSEMBLY_ACC=CAM_ASM_000251 /TAXON_ID=180227 /ORGANISM="Neoparamoeba aestuarina, Strain SoJaBio B1-5/56/2" /LENGTH=183 /DNA_ID=CAMNT_0047915905 /DNA_START=30 /DNA_END=577 /DNA_ORIENTATION=-
MANARAQLASEETEHFKGKWGEKQRDNLVFLEQKKYAILSAIANDFDTVLAINLLRKIVEYAEQPPAGNETSDSGRLKFSHLENQELSLFVDVVQDFLVLFGFDLNELSSMSGGEKTAAGESKKVSDLLNLLTKFRHDVRTSLLSNDLSEKEKKQKILGAGDEVREDLLKNHHVRVQDSHAEA